MNARFLGVGLILLAAAMPPAAIGQYVTPGPEYVPMSTVVPGYGYGYGNRYASTEQEGVLTGYANLLQGMGVYEMYHANALTQWEQARAMDLQNAKIEFFARVEFRNIQKQIAADETKRIAERNLQLQALRPTPHPVRPVVQTDGRILWPADLMNPQFQPYRAALEAEFQQLANGHQEAAGAIQTNLDDMVHFVGARVRAGEMDKAGLMAAIAFRDQARTAARTWNTTNVPTALAQR